MHIYAFDFYRNIIIIIIIIISEISGYFVERHGLGILFCVYFVKFISCSMLWESSPVQ